MRRDLLKNYKWLAWTGEKWNGDVNEFLEVVCYMYRRDVWRLFGVGIATGVAVGLALGWWIWRV